MASIKNHHEFKEAVRVMRQAQKSYFATRDIGAFKRSKKYEQLVDDYLLKL